MQRLYDRCVAAIQLFSALLCAAMLGVVLVGVFYRYVVDSALSWYDEFAGFILVWLTMYGSVVGLARGKHISFDTLVEKLSPAARQVVEIFSVLCVAGFSAVMLVSGWHLVSEMVGETAVSVTAVQMSWIYSVMPISGALMLAVCVVKLVGIARGGKHWGGAPGKPMEEGQ